MVLLACIAFILSAVVVVADNLKSCKCFPGDACFPSQETWDAFSKKLSQPVIANQKPLASVCYQSSSTFDSSGCALVTRNQFNGTYLATSPNAVQWTNFEALITNISVQQCPFSPTADEKCFQGRVPVVSVNATSVQDIQETFAFATAHNLRLVVRNTGQVTCHSSLYVSHLPFVT